VAVVAVEAKVFLVLPLWAAKVMAAPLPSLLSLSH
jgi:hypothetical protein